MRTKTLKYITDKIAEFCHVPIRDVCVLNHDDNHFKVYVHGTSWYCDSVYRRICDTWGVTEDNITVEMTPKFLWFNSTGYTIHVTY